jgi:hypothetical protein
MRVTRIGAKQTGSRAIYCRCPASSAPRRGEVDVAPIDICRCIRMSHRVVSRHVAQSDTAFLHVRAISVAASTPSSSTKRAAWMRPFFVQRLHSSGVGGEECLVRQAGGELPDVEGPIK